MSMPRAVPERTARTMFSEFPEVERTMRTSPARPRASIQREKIWSKPKSLAVQVMWPTSEQAMAGSGGRSLRNRPVSSSAKCMASQADPPLPQIMTLLPAAKHSIRRSPTRWTVATAWGSATRALRDLWASCREWSIGGSVGFFWTRRGRSAVEARYGRGGDRA